MQSILLSPIHVTTPSWDLEAKKLTNETLHRKGVNIDNKMVIF